MCLITFAYEALEDYPLIIVANRDEFYERPTATAHFWEDEPTILAGRDLLQGGSWMGVSVSGRFAAITNHRDPSLPESGLLSRGEIVQQFLTSSMTSSAFLSNLRSKKQAYGGFNVLVFDGKELQHYNNILNEGFVVESGVHSLSNGSLHSTWPKMIFAQTNLKNALTQHEKINAERLLPLLLDQTQAPDKALPDTGVGIHLERLLSSLFVKMPNYGTRCSTAIVFHKNGHIEFVERTYADGEFQFDRTFNIQL